MVRTYYAVRHNPTALQSLQGGETHNYHVPGHLRDASILGVIPIVEPLAAVHVFLSITFVGLLQMQNIKKHL